MEWSWTVRLVDVDLMLKGAWMLVRLELLERTMGK